MWSYYRQANFCYAYIADVSSEVVAMKENPRSRFAEVLASCSEEQKDTLMQLCESRWFQRGWTFQELIAPRVLLFYDAAWHRIGSRDGRLSRLIHCITDIPERILNAGMYLEEMLRSTSVAKRMSWAASRSCTRLEDEAYCLLGIFDINMPMLYGEGSKAFKRLQEEIIKISTDHSIFARTSSDYNSLLARRPLYFRNCGNIDACEPDEPMESYSMTNRGLMITLPVLQEWAAKGAHKPAKILVALNCKEKGRLFELKLEQVTRTEAPPKLLVEYQVVSAHRGLNLLPGEVENAQKRAIIIVRD
jgi:hypothetical protein